MGGKKEKGVVCGMDPIGDLLTSLLCVTAQFLPPGEFLLVVLVLPPCFSSRGCCLGLAVTEARRGCWKDDHHSWSHPRFHRTRIHNID